MRRREFITLLGSAAAWVSPARAQEPRRVIGVLCGFGLAGFFADLQMPAFVQGLKDAGFVEGRNISIEIRRADGHYDRLPSLAAELVGRNLAALYATDVPSAFAAKAATKTIPIVFAIGADPIKVGLVDSLSRPKDNLTGVSAFLSVLGPKRVELLHELLPTADTIALLANPGNVNIKTDAPEIRAAADRLKHHLELLTASTESDLEAAFATMVQHRVGSLIVMPDPFFISRSEQLVALAARHAMPAIYPLRTFADLGGLMSYGSSVLDLNRQTGTASNLETAPDNCERDRSQCTKEALIGTSHPRGSVGVAPFLCRTISTAAHPPHLSLPAYRRNCCSSAQVRTHLHS
jgi:putative tryptophan/tyrosine transport system substrate-binding protein